MQQRTQPSASLCEFADRLDRVANVLFSKISEGMTPSQWQACQMALWSFYQELAAELKQRGQVPLQQPGRQPAPLRCSGVRGREGNA
jgi:hypothetical protein